MINNDLTHRTNIGGARNLARKLLKDARIREVPVSLEKIINYLKSQHANFDVLRFSFLDKESGISGITIAEEGNTTIGFNPNHPWVRRRFTIAHEIGHWRLGHVGTEGNYNEHAEQEAHQFAAELLVPLEFIKKDYKLNPNLDELAKKYIVSKEALCRHLVECRIL